MVPPPERDASRSAPLRAAPSPSATRATPPVYLQERSGGQGPEPKQGTGAGGVGVPGARLQGKCGNRGQGRRGQGLKGQGPRGPEQGIREAAGTPGADQGACQEGRGLNPGPEQGTRGAANAPGETKGRARRTGGGGILSLRRTQGQPPLLPPGCTGACGARGTAWAHLSMGRAVGLPLVHRGHTRGAGAGTGSESGTGQRGRCSYASGVPLGERGHLRRASICAGGFLMGRTASRGRGSLGHEPYRPWGALGAPWGEWGRPGESMPLQEGLSLVPTVGGGGERREVGAWSGGGVPGVRRRRRVVYTRRIEEVVREEEEEEEEGGCPPLPTVQWVMT